MLYIRKSSLVLTILILILVLLFSGCTTAQKPAPAPQDPATNENTTRTQDVDPEKNEYQSQPASDDQALKIAATADEVPGVVKSQVVVYGNTAYIGLDLNSNMKINKSEVRQQVDNNIRKKNPNLDSLYITTDPTVIERLRDINQGIAEGKPSSTYDFDALKELFKTEP